MLEKSKSTVGVFNFVINYVHLQLCFGLSKEHALSFKQGDQILLIF